jgi:lysophospholipase L1-like esterase
LKTGISNIRFRYLALGDSYTIGESVSAEHSFPAQLVKAIEKHGGWNNTECRIIASTGWTTDELLAAIQQENPAAHYDLVSLLIGVNNQYRGYPRTQYSREFRLLIEKAVALACGNPCRVMVIAIPDYGCTPYGNKNAKEIHDDLIWYNGEAREIAADYGIPFCDIFPVSRLAASMPELTAEDQLHPSPLQYNKWMEVILPMALRSLKNEI